MGNASTAICIWIGAKSSSLSPLPSPNPGIFDIAVAIPLIASARVRAVLTSPSSSALNDLTFSGSEKKSIALPANSVRPPPMLFRVSPRFPSATSNLDTPSGPLAVKSDTHLLNEAPVSENHLPMSGSLFENPLIRSRKPWVKSRIPGAAADRPLAMLRMVWSSFARFSGLVRTSENDLAISAKPCVTLGNAAFSVGNMSFSFSNTGVNCSCTLADMVARSSSNGCLSTPAAFLSPSRPNTNAPIGTTAAVIRPGSANNEVVRAPRRPATNGDSAAMAAAMSA
ncbi:Uncharacterised protein [Mycobacteroides abscessus subsp. abscessus]|nr:Uncharacterised protein [Mycobacteroides abscessus subsp. abscessus]